ncbi:type I toxin-antitoxin system Fst family toxin [Staphylococcus chromogenes]|nr:type I toxin-antitoxin system Fst family toxin [Staphylococcus chromogenes]
MSPENISLAPVISGCAVAYYTYWLSKRNK